MRHIFIIFVCIIFSGCSSPSLIDDAKTATSTRGPYLQQGSPDSIIVRWRTDTPSAGKLWYDTKGWFFFNKKIRLKKTVAESKPTKEHEIKITGLKPKTKYYYALGNEGDDKHGVNEQFFFITSPAYGTEVSEKSPTRIWVIGDSGTASKDARNVYQAYQKFNGDRYTDLWLMLGDNAYGSGTDKQYQKAVFDMYPELLAQTPLWPTIGNHDEKSLDTEKETGPYYDMFTLPTKGEVSGLASGTESYYSFDYANIHFLCLASIGVDRGVGAAMYEWAKKDLSETKAKWLIVFFHHPTYTKGSHDSDREKELIEMRENYMPMLEEAGVDLVLTGHSHSYERSHLIDGHYGKSDSLDKHKHFIDAGDGHVDGSGAYIKETFGLAPHEGSVNIVAGSSGKVTKANSKESTLDHPVMFLSLRELGSVVIDVASNKMKVKFLNHHAKTKDYFMILKRR
jgi:hypothetical protein